MKYSKIIIKKIPQNEDETRRRYVIRGECTAWYKHMFKK